MDTWKNKTVVVTGGSAGLGEAIAREFIGRGAKVAVISRTPPNQPLSNSRHFAANVTNDRSVETAVKEIAEHFGRIDVWINNVGQSIRTSLSDSTVEDYQRLLEINFLSAVRCSLAVLPHVEKTSGSIVQIGSLASKTGWKHVAPYVTSKHALAGFAHQLRLEAPPNVHSMLVCPGPIRREDSATRYADQSEGLDQSVAAPGAGVKISGIDPAVLAKKVADGIQRRQPELVVPAKTRLLFALLQLSPRYGDWLLRQFA